MKKKKVTPIVLVLTLLAQMFLLNTFALAMPTQNKSLKADVITDPTLNAAIRTQYSVPAGQVLDPIYVQQNVTGWLDASFINKGINTITSLDGLQYATDLVAINVSGNPGITDIDDLAHLSNLQEIYVFGCGITQLPATNTWTSLTVLSLSNNPGPIDLNFVTGLTNLQILSVGDCGVTSLPPTNSWTNLKQLYINDNPSIGTLDPVKNISTLTLLSAQNCGINTLPATNLWNNMEDMDISLNHITDLSPINNVITGMTNPGVGPGLDRFYALNQTITNSSVSAATGSNISIPNPFINYNNIVVAPNTFTTTGSTYASGTNTVSVPVDATNTTSFSIPPTSVGSHFRANFSGTVTQPYTLLAVPTVALTATPATSTFGTPVTFTAAVTGSAGVPTGTVTFNIDGTVVTPTPVALNTSGVATYTTTATQLSVGPHSITATYNGNTSYGTKTNTIPAYAVAKATPTITITPNPVGGANFGSNVTFTASVTGIPSTLPTGTVTFNIDGTVVTPTPVALNTSGVATYTTTATQLSVGPHSITATYNGNTSYGTKTNTIPAYAVAKATPTITITPNPVGGANFGSNVTFTASVTGIPSTLPTGTVSFKIDGTVVTPTPVGLNSSGNAVYTASGLTASAHTIEVAYSGDANYDIAVSQINYDVRKLTPTVTLTANPASGVTYGGNVTFTAKVIGTGSTPGGTITFNIDGRDMLPAVTLDANGEATYTATGLTATGLSGGGHTIIAKYNGDTVYNISNAIINPYNLAKANSKLTLKANPVSPSAYGDSVTFTATVTGILGDIPTGTVNFSIDGTNAGAVTIDARGKAIYTTTMPAGDHTIVASYNGDTNYNVSNNSMPYTVKKAPTTSPGVTTNPSGSNNSNGATNPSGSNNSNGIINSSNSNGPDGSNGSNASGNLIIGSNSIGGVSGSNVSGNSSDTNVINPKTGAIYPFVFVLIGALMLAATALIVKIRYKQ